MTNPPRPILKLPNKRTKPKSLNQVVWELAEKNADRIYARVGKHYEDMGRSLPLIR